MKDDYIPSSLDTLINMPTIHFKWTSDHERMHLIAEEKLQFGSTEVFCTIFDC